MTTPASMTKTLADATLKRVREALKTLTEETGLVFQISGTARYTNNDLSMKVVATVPADGMDASNPYAAEWSAWLDFAACEWRNLDPKATNVTLENGDRVTIVGCKPRSRKYPILAQKENGQVYKYASQAIAAAQARAKAREVTK